MHGWMWYGGVGKLVLAERNLNGAEFINITEISFLPSVRDYAVLEPLLIYIWFRTILHSIHVARCRSGLHATRKFASWTEPLKVAISTR